MRGRSAVAAALIAALGLAGCGRDATGYESLSALAAAVSDSGVSCDDVEAGAPARLTSENGSCRGSGVNLFLFEDRQDVEAWKTVGSRLGPALLGPNWAVTGDRAAVERIASELGGEVE